MYTAARNYHRMVELWLLTQKKKFVLKNVNVKFDHHSKFYEVPIRELFPNRKVCIVRTEPPVTILL